ncbi:MAG: AI-2E family transporter [Clostridiales bacterium]|nr:AI-2E family transporter [Clostridiales bacterium]
MKFTPDGRYFKASVYTLFTLVSFYILKNIIDAAVLTLANIDIIFKSLADFVGRAFSLFSLPLTAFVIAYILDPLCEFCQNFYNKSCGKAPKRRIQGTAAAYGIILLAGAVLIFFAGKFIGDNFSADTFLNETAAQLDTMHSNVIEFLKRHDLYTSAAGYVNTLWSDILNFFDNLGNSFIKGAAGFGGIVLNIALGFVIAFYFLIDKEKYLGLTKRSFKFLLPKKIYSSAAEIIFDCHSVFSGYIRGQLTDAFIMSLLISSFLIMFRIKFAVLIGLISGFSNIIPYFGAITGFCLAVLSALLSGEPLKAVYAAVIMVILQQIDSVFIAPKIVGEKVELSPPAVIIALTVGGKLLGIWGMIFAVPFCGILKIALMNHYCRRSRDTGL